MGLSVIIPPRVEACSKQAMRSYAVRVKVLPYLSWALWPQWGLGRSSMESKGKAQEGEKPWEWKMGREPKADMGLLSCTAFPCSRSWGFHHGTTATAHPLVSQQWWHQTTLNTSFRIPCGWCDLQFCLKSVPWLVSNPFLAQPPTFRVSDQFCLRCCGVGQITCGEMAWHWFF